VNGVRVWFVCAPPVWTRICSGIAFRREQGIVVANCIGHTPEIAPGGVCIRASYRPVFTVQSETSPFTPVILNSIQDLPGEGGASYEEIPT
jgi:hypothetical protein